MKKNYKIEIDCANCAAKVESAMNDIDGVKAKMSFMAQKLVFEANDAVFDAKLHEAIKIAKKIEPDFEIEL